MCLPVGRVPTIELRPANSSGAKSHFLIKLNQRCMYALLLLLFYNLYRRCGSFEAIHYAASFAGSMYGPYGNAAIVNKGHRLQKFLVYG